MTTLKQIITAIIATAVLFASKYISRLMANHLSISGEVVFDVAYILAAIITLLIIYILHKKFVPLQLNIRKRCNLTTTIYELIALFIIIRIFSIIVGVIAVYIDNELITAGNIDMDFTKMGAVDLLILVVSSSIAAPIVEEIIFRGILLNAMSRIMSIRNAVIITSLIFGLLHRTSVATVVITTILGIALACIYIANNNLINSIIVHGLYNLLALFISYKIQVIDPWIQSLEILNFNPLSMLLGGAALYIWLGVIAYDKLEAKYGKRRQY